MNKSILYAVILLSVPFFIMGQQIENSGFEEWEDAGTVVDEPVDWSSIKTADVKLIADAAPITFEKSTDAHSGNYALKLYNVSAFGLVATGAICNGRFHAEFDLSKSFSYTDTNDARWNMQIGARPDSLAGWFKFFPSEIDKAQFKVILHVDECKLPENGTLQNWVAEAVFQTEPGVTYDTWTRFCVPFNYYREDKPEYLLCVINSGDSTSAYEGSYLIADDLELIYSTSAGTDEPQALSDFMHISGRVVTIGLDREESYIGKQFKIIDFSGRTVYSETITGSVLNDIPKTVPAGMYVAVLESDNTRYVQKFLLGQ